ncbi:MAG: hypothetical protein ACXAC6_08645 [Candidatus Hodarchaeales archaeon]|jgi:hypothetical protein
MDDFYLSRLLQSISEPKNNSFNSDSDKSPEKSTNQETIFIQ